MATETGAVIKAEDQIRETRDALIVELYRFNGSTEGRWGGGIGKHDYRLALITRIALLDWVLGEDDNPDRTGSLTPLTSQLSDFVKQKRELFERIGVSSVGELTVRKERGNGD